MKILLVDDEEGFLHAMGTVLRDQGYEVTTAADGKQAREALDGVKFDVIMSDVFMPTLDGVRFHSYVREFTDARDVPFIFISGYDDQHTRGLAQDSPRDFFLSKTTPIEDVIALVEKVKNLPPTGAA
jgi:CheY-like chemotaxis protein